MKNVSDDKLAGIAGGADNVAIKRVTGDGRDVRSLIGGRTPVAPGGPGTGTPETEGGNGDGTDNLMQK
jgi:hypothetical protein